jgi:hypothetical protein
VRGRARFEGTRSLARRSDVKAMIAALHFILSSSAKYDVAADVRARRSAAPIAASLTRRRRR